MSQPHDLSGTMKITAKIPHSTYVDLKTYCALNRIEMKDVVADALDRFLKSNASLANRAVA